jgi:hypothetical protein
MPPMANDETGVGSRSVHDSDGSTHGKEWDMKGSGR